MATLLIEKGRVAVRRRIFLLAVTAYGVLRTAYAFAAEAPRGFFIEDLRRTPPIPALYNLETRKPEPLALKDKYVEFLDVVWDRPRKRIFFSARHTRQEPFRIYLKDWPDGEEKSIYENPTGPFRFLLSPDGDRLALQIMGPSSWPILGVYAWKDQKWTALGEGFSPDWGPDGKELLFLKIPGALPTYLYEYNVAKDAAEQLISEPVMEAVYTDDAQQIVLKTAKQSERCDVFQMWNRRNGRYANFALPNAVVCKQKQISQRELSAFPGHRYFLFKESMEKHNRENQNVVVADAWGGRLQEVAPSVWDPVVAAVEETTLAVSEDPIYVLTADGAGGKREIPQARYIRLRQ
jgi:hypothetical protein